MTLNTFLRKLPELAVDGIRFERSESHSEYTRYILRCGVWKLRKIGYNAYAVTRVSPIFKDPFSEWSSSETAGNIEILGLRVSLTGVIVSLGLDTPYEDD